MSKFVNLLNFRDLGGIKTSCGRRVRAKRLLRAALPAGLSETEVEALRGYDLKQIVDFRTRAEVEDSPVDEIEGVAYTHLDIMGDNVAQTANPGYWLDFFQNDPTGVEEAFKDTYREFAISSSSAAGYSAFVKGIAAADGATLFHCAAGKDRTGFGAAIILKILGVSLDDIFDDYMKTQTFLDQVDEYYTTRAKKRGFSEEQIADMGKVFGVMKKSYLEAAIEAAEGAFGSFEKYISHGLGITEEEIEKIKQFYLE